MVMITTALMMVMMIIATGVGVMITIVMTTMIK